MIGRSGGAAVEALVWWVVCTAVWQATVTTPTVQEWVASAVFAVPVACCARGVRHAVRGAWRPPADTVILSALLVPAIVSDAVGAVWLAIRNRGEGAEFAEIPVPFERSAARRAGRAAFATMLTCAGPGTLVVGADREQRHLHVHRLPLRPTAMARRMRRYTSTGDRR